MVGWLGIWRCHEESRRFRLMRTRRGDAEEEVEDDEEEEVDAREASRSRASWFLYQRILSAEMRMKSFLGWSATLWRLEGRGEVTRAIVGNVLVWCVGMVEVLAGAGEGCLRNLLARFGSLVGSCVYCRLLAGNPKDCRFNGKISYYVSVGALSRACESSMIGTSGLGFTRVVELVITCARGESPPG